MANLIYLVLEWFDSRGKTAKICSRTHKQMSETLSAVYADSIKAFYHTKTYTAWIWVGKQIIGVLVSVSSNGNLPLIHHWEKYVMAWGSFWPSAPNWVCRTLFAVNQLAYWLYPSLQGFPQSITRSGHVSYSHHFDDGSELVLHV